MNKNILISLVKKEASKLKKKATKEEISRLGYEIYPKNRFRCVYGRMTRDCFSSRAHFLIMNCAERVYVKDVIEEINESKLNGKAQLDGDGNRKEYWYSPIECFIDFEENKTNGNNQMLVDYIKGKRKTLSFKKF